MLEDAIYINKPSWSLGPMIVMGSQSSSILCLKGCKAIRRDDSTTRRTSLRVDNIRDDAGLHERAHISM